MKLEVSLSQAAAIALALTLEAQAAERNAADCEEAGTLYADSWRGIAKSMKEICELVQSQRKLALQKDEQTAQAAQDDERKRRDEDDMASPKLTALQKQYVVEALETSLWVECHDEEEHIGLDIIKQKLQKGYGLSSMEEALLKKWLTGRGPHATKSEFARAYMADIAENLKDWDEETK